MRFISSIKITTLKLVVTFLQKTALLSALSCRLVQLTRKHKDRIHPKHLIKIRRSWYLSYIKKTDTVLDVGCNNGQHSIKAAQKCKKVHGFDYDEHVLQLAKKEADRLGVENAEFEYGDAEKKFSYKNNAFDTVLFLDVFEHLNNRKKPLEEIFRVLKPNGYLLISIPKSDTNWKKLQKSLGFFYFSDPDHKVEFTKKEIRQILERAGFKIKKMSPVTFDTPFVGFIDLAGGFSLKFYSLLSKWRRKKAFQNMQDSISLEIVCQKN